MVENVREHTLKFMFYNGEALASLKGMEGCVLTDVAHFKVRPNSGFGTENHAYILGNGGATVSTSQVLIGVENSATGMAIGELERILPNPSQLKTDNSHEYFRNIVLTSPKLSVEIYINDKKMEGSNVEAAKETALNLLAQSEKIYTELTVKNNNRSQTTMTAEFIAHFTKPGNTFTLDIGGRDLSPKNNGRTN